MNENLRLIQQAKHHDPFNWLGWHPLPDGNWVLRVFLPAAEAVRVAGTSTELTRIPNSDCFEYTSSSALPSHPLLQWQDKQSSQWYDVISPYTFAPQIGDLDLHLLGEGRHHHTWTILGAHMRTVDSIEGCLFSIWAPHVHRVSVVGNFNHWDGRVHQMRSRGKSGIWELFIPGVQPGMAYKYEILARDERVILKTDPYAQQMFLRPETASQVANTPQHQWQDQAWLTQRQHFDWQHKPLSIYELHAGSWRKHPDGRFYSWADLTDSLIPYVKGLNYTHIELLPIAEHPLDESWGYQISGYYAPSARYGSPDELRAFIDACHQADIGVLLDWVPAHFPKDDFALAQFTGEPLYEHPDKRRGEHQDWGTLIFDYGRNEVKNFLFSNALYWIDEFHIDGLRVDAVASMLYLDYSRNPGDWTPNHLGGRENLEAIEFLREMNTVVHLYHPNALTIAEESTSWPAVTRPIEFGGLGFNMKWNMGWMNDNLRYIQNAPIHRKYHHNLLTFTQMYAYTENFILPLSHDEVVHLKRSMLDKMPGDYWQVFANLRLFYAWQYAHPGKKLLFMGGEFGQWTEWNVKKELDWALCSFPAHDSLRHLVRDLNALHKEQAALHYYDFDARGFQWIDCNDSDQSVLSLLRFGATPDDAVVVLLNFTPVPRYAYRIGVPNAAAYRELLNTDSEFYGGSNCGNAGTLAVSAVPWMGFEQSIEITLPPLGALFLQACS